MPFQLAKLRSTPDSFELAPRSSSARTAGSRKGAVGGQREVGHQLADLVVEGLGAGQELESGARVVATHTRKRDELFAAGVTRGHGLAVAVVVGRRDTGGEAHSTLAQGLREQGLHGFELGRRRLFPNRARSHDGAAHRGVAHHEAGIDRDAAIEPAEVVAEGLPIPGHALAQALDGHALDPGEHGHEVVRGLLGERRDAEPAVATEDGRHAVVAGGRERAVPEHLGVVVGMGVDEARADHAVAGIDGLSRVLVDVSDGDDASRSDPHVCRASGRSGSVDHRSAANEDVEHGDLPCAGSFPEYTPGIREAG
jgi:hypothetical protein